MEKCIKISQNWVVSVQNEVFVFVLDRKLRLGLQVCFRMDAVILIQLSCFPLSSFSLVLVTLVCMLHVICVASVFLSWPSVFLNLYHFQRLTAIIQCKWVSLFYQRAKDKTLISQWALTSILNPISVLLTMSRQLGKFIVSILAVPGS